MSKRSKFSPEFKCEAVALTRQPGLSCRQIALEIGINLNLLSRCHTTVRPWLSVHQW